jgi:hypothetical protein
LLVTFGWDYLHISQLNAVCIFGGGVGGMIAVAELLATIFVLYETNT